MLNKVARKGTCCHHMDLSRVLGHALDRRQDHSVIKAETPDVGVLKGLDKKLTAINIRTCTTQLNTTIKGISRATPLAGAFFSRICVPGSIG